MVEPKGIKNIMMIKDIQNRIDDALLSDKYRCFIRASGTEDVVRVYAEGPDESVVEDLIKRVENIVRVDP